MYVPSCVRALRCVAYRSVAYRALRCVALSCVPCFFTLSSIQPRQCGSPTVLHCHFFFHFHFHFYFPICRLPFAICQFPHFSLCIFRFPGMYIWPIHPVIRPQRAHVVPSYANTPFDEFERAPLARDADQPVSAPNRVCPFAHVHTANTTHTAMSTCRPARPLSIRPHSSPASSHRGARRRQRVLTQARPCVHVQFRCVTALCHMRMDTSCATFAYATLLWQSCTLCTSPYCTLSAFSLLPAHI